MGPVRVVIRATAGASCGASGGLFRLADIQVPAFDEPSQLIRRVGGPERQGDVAVRSHQVARAALEAGVLGGLAPREPIHRKLELICLFDNAGSRLAVSVCNYQDSDCSEAKLSPSAVEIHGRRSPPGPRPPCPG